MKTPEQAAEEYSEKRLIEWKAQLVSCEPMTTDDIAEAFKAGAQWERERSKVLVELVESDIGCDQEPKITTDVVQYIHSDNCRKCQALANYRATGWTEK